MQCKEIYQLYEHREELSTEFARFEAEGFNIFRRGILFSLSAKSLRGMGRWLCCGRIIFV